MTDFSRSLWPTTLPLVAILRGINPCNLANYLQAGCIGAGLGGELYRPGQSPQDTGVRASAFVAAWQAAMS